MGYGLTQSLQLMQNHVPADVLDAVHGFDAFSTPQGAYILLAIGNDDVYRATVETSDSSTGWGVYDISNDLASMVQSIVASDATFVAKKSAASMDPSTGTLTALLAVTVISSSASFAADLLFMLTGPPDTDPSVWLRDHTQRAWTALPFAPANLPSTLDGMSASNLKVSKLLLEMGIDATAPAVSLALVENPAFVGELVLFSLTTATGTSANKPWVYLNQQSFGEDPMVAEGRMVTGRNKHWGLYSLSKLNNVTTLMFQAQQAEFSPGPGNPVVFQSNDVSAIASLVYSNEDYGGQPYTDLFAANSGSIICYSCDAGTQAPGTVVLQDSMITNVSQLHAVHSNTHAYIWGFSQNSSDEKGTIFYTSASISDIESSTGWSKPVALMTNVSMATVFHSTDVNTCAICVIAPLSSNTATSGALVAPQVLALNPTTGHWSTTILPMPSTDSCLTLQTYTTRVQLTNGAAAVGGQIITAAVNVACTLNINGKPTNVEAGSTVQVVTDPAGCLTFVYPVSSLAGASFTLTLPGPDATEVIVNAASDTITTLKNVSGQSLKDAKYTATDGSTQDLVPDSMKDDNKLGTIAATTSQLASLSTTLQSSSKTSLADRQLRARTLHAAMDDGSVKMHLGDFVQFVTHVVDNVDAVQFNPVPGSRKNEESIWQIIVHVGEEIFSAIIQTAEDALHAVLAVFKWIEATFEKIFQWLAFLFNWKTYVEVHDILLDSVNAAITAISDNIDPLVEAGVTFLQRVETQVVNHFDPNSTFSKVSAASSATDVFNEQAGQPQPKGNTNVQTDSRLGWVHDRASTKPSTTGSKQRLALRKVHAGDAIDGFGDAVKQVLGNTEKLLTAIASDLVSVVGGGMPPREFLTSVITTIATTSIEDLVVLIRTLGKSISQIAPLVQNYLNSPIDIPILSALFRWATKDNEHPDGQDLTVLSFICLIQGIVFSITYEIAETAAGASNIDPVAFLKGLDLQNKVTAGIAGLSAVLSGSTTAATGSLPQPNMSARPGEEDDPGPKTLTGCLLVGQSISAFVIALLEMIIPEEAPMIEQEALFMAYLADLSNRLLRGAIELIDDANREAYGSKAMVATELGFHCLWVMMGVVCAVSEKPELNFRHLMKGDEIVSLAWGGWELADILAGDVECDLDHSFEIAVELSELIVGEACETAEMNPSPESIAIAGGLSGIRCLAVVGAGIMRL